MAVSPFSAALRSAPGYAPRPASPAPVVTGAFPALPTLPTVPTIDDARAPNAATRQWLLSQLGPWSQQNNAALTNIRAGAKLNLAGYGGWKFAEDDPNTAQREDLQLSFDPNAGPGEREKGAIRGERNQANARGMLYSSFASQNIAQAVQRLSLEAQQIANQFASAIMQQQTGYANQVSQTIGQWTQLYGQDAAWLAENPPPPPPPPAAPAPAPAQPLALATPTSQPGSYPVWTGSNPPNLQSLAKAWGVPVGAIRVTPLAGGKYRAWAQAAPPGHPV